MTVAVWPSLPTAIVMSYLKWRTGLNFRQGLSGHRVGLSDVPLVEFMYLVFTVYLWWSLCTLYLHCTSGGVYVPCIYMHARWELP